MTRTFQTTAFLAGLAAVGWVAIGYVGLNPLALAVTLLIGAFYLMGGAELQRYGAATATLARAVAEPADAPANLADWLGRLHPSLQNPVRLRIEGERVGLPGPALTPYLSGLLVLLGMLGTFLGMVVTLRGTGVALESASDLQAIRASLATPVKGLGLAFGTSLAGVAASAMLGLVAALCRRDRLLVAQRLDTRIATTLREFSLAQHRDTSLALLRRQGEAMPELVERLCAMMASLERQNLALTERLASDQQDFHARTEAAYGGLAASIDRSLKDSLAESARLASAAIQPVVEATMAGIAREAAALHQGVAGRVGDQLDALSGRFEASTAAAAGLWQEALDEHRRTSSDLADALRTQLGATVQQFATGSQALVEGVASRMERAGDTLSATWQDALARHEHVTDRGARDARDAWGAAAAGFQQHAAALGATVDAAHLALQERVATGDRERLQAWTLALEEMAGSLRQEWQRAGAAHADHQARICTTLAETAQRMSVEAEARARDLLAEIAGLMQTAAAAPRAAAEAIAEFRRHQADSLGRDNALLEERGRLLASLETVLAAVEGASAGQHESIAALVGASTELLDRVGARFADSTAAETGKLSAVAAQVGSSAAEVASLGEAFGFAVQAFGETSQQLGAQLQRIEVALGKSTVRSDEQLAYYVGQAREVIDLSILSQRQIVESLQQLAEARVSVGSAA